MHELQLEQYNEKKKRFKAGGRWVWHLVDPERPAGTINDLGQIQWPEEVLDRASRFALGATLAKHVGRITDTGPFEPLLPGIGEALRGYESQARAYQSRRGPRPKPPRLEATEEMVDNETVEEAIAGVGAQFPSYTFAPKSEAIAALRFFKEPTAAGLFALGDPGIIRAALRSALNQMHPGGANDPAAVADRMLVLSHRD